MIGDDVTQWFGSLDMIVVAGIAVIAFLLHRSKLRQDVATFIPLTLGVLYGGWSAIEQTHWFGTHVVKTALAYGGGCTVFARLASIGLKKFWDGTEAGGDA